MVNVSWTDLKAPFSVTDTVYTKVIEAALHNTLGQIQGSLEAPLLACVTLWIIIQGILVIRGDIDTRKGFTKLIMVALVVSLVTSSDLYSTYVDDLFTKAIPQYIENVGNDGAAPLWSLPEQLDGVFIAGEKLFLSISEHLPDHDLTDTYSLEGAQFIFVLTLWGIFGVYDLTALMTNLMVSIGPLILIGFLFEATRDITTKWIGQLISYGLLLLFISVIATIVVGIELAGVIAMTVLTRAKPEVAELLGLWELDIFLMTGNAVVIALPGIAAALGGGVAAAIPRFVNSFYRRFHGLDSNNPHEVMNRFFMSGGMQ